MDCLLEFADIEDRTPAISRAIFNAYNRTVKLNNKKKVRVAVIGVGYLGRIHASIYHQMDDVDLIAVVDTDEEAAHCVAQDCGCQALTRAEDVLRRVEAVSIVVPTSVHLPVARPFLEAGIHTLLEKPVAPTVEESAMIVRIAQAGGAILQVGHVERFNAGVMKIAELARQPRFIEVHRLGEFSERAADVDVVTDLMIHDIDIVLSLIGVRLASISATGAPVVTDHVDIANARLEFENGAVANVTSSRVSTHQFRRIRVFSEDRYLGLNFLTQQLSEIRTGKKNQGSHFAQLERRDIPVSARQPLNVELAHFIDCVKQGGRPLVNGADGLVAVEVAEMVKKEISRRGY